MAGQNEPIKMIATFVEKATPMDGLKTPLEAFVGRSRSAIEPIHMLPNADGLTQPADFEIRRELSALLFAKFKAVSEASLSANDVLLARSWIEGRNEKDVAAQLNWTVDAVRVARERLSRRIHVTIDPQPS
jgi:hypothetical protein